MKNGATCRALALIAVSVLLGKGESAAQLQGRSQGPAGPAPGHDSPPSINFDQGIRTSDLNLKQDDPIQVSGPDKKAVTTQESPEELFAQAIEAIQKIKDSDKKRAQIEKAAKEIRSADLKLESQKKLFQMLVKTAGSVDDPYERLHAYLELAGSMTDSAKARKDPELFAEALKTVGLADGALREGIKQDPKRARAGSFVLSGLLVTSYRRNILNAIAGTEFDPETKKAFFARFQEIGQKMEDPADRAEFMTWLGSMMHKAGYGADEVNGIFSSAAEAAKKVGDPAVQAGLLMGIAEAKLAAGLK